MGRRSNTHTHKKAEAAIIGTGSKYWARQCFFFFLETFAISLVFFFSSNSINIQSCFFFLLFFSLLYKSFFLFPFGYLKAVDLSLFQRRLLFFFFLLLFYY